MDKPLSFYLLHLAGNIFALISLFLFYYSIFHHRDFDAFVKNAYEGVRELKWHKKLAWYAPSRLWRTAIIMIALIGGYYICYAVFKQMFSWVPHNWVDEDNNWQAYSIACFLSFFGLIGIMFLLKKITEMVITKDRALMDLALKESYLRGITKLQESTGGKIEYYFDYCSTFVDDLTSKEAILLNTIYTSKVSHKKIRSIPNNCYQYMEAVKAIRRKVGFRIENINELLELLCDDLNDIPDEIGHLGKFYWTKEREYQYNARLIELLSWAKLNEKLDVVTDFLNKKAIWGTI